MSQDLEQKLWSIASGIPFVSDYFLQASPARKLKKENLFSKVFETYFLELGSGWGEVAIAMALQRRNTGFVLMEKKFDRIRHTIREIEKHSLDNVKILCVNFNWFLADVFEENLFSEILLNFPDPWPKKRHHKKRTINSKFLESLKVLLPEKGKFSFATDYGPYARKTIRLFRDSEIFKPETMEFRLERKEIPVSHFERKKRKEGKRIYYIDQILIRK
ncbi:tRNA (guanine(46)-N(7))-methyltransferase TrmB [Leptospira borgpetersenii]|uniref:tRNA (guanine(46)-N(7))-methyltransferase TrmB n=1 Tax=Leptospira borgpetersenii TaxID=174 RepID=UPI00034A312F|nr:tRNA (guanine-N7)-methyltransferase [Leptospira borgpetersenii]URD70095.1 tRNA (guanine-N7)-methyltransferase [Leptospira borgpetersenii]UVD73270.1 tRNA (guanine-N7)-methyltransferase [Leptospira borgpetersenii]UVD76458.1 tRNA (guanine-N7)-methyltransferase [Leptospira borgpetersenii]UZW33020.1 tRNA (guanine-N7)-methyltransferase [Leptospira borgpetersenii]